jgi:hypothetical protein
MKTIKRITIILFLTLFISDTEAANFKLNRIVSIADSEFVAVAIKSESAIDLHVSFNGNEGSTGTLKIFNADNQLVHVFQIELKAAPNFYNVNLNEFSDGQYTLELTTTNAVHTTQITIQ